VKRQLGEGDLQPHPVVVNKRVLLVKSKGMAAHGELSKQHINERGVWHELIGVFHDRDHLIAVFADNSFVVIG